MVLASALADAAAAVKSLLRLTPFRRNTHNKIKTISPSPGVIIGSDFTLGLAAHASAPTYETLYSGEWIHPAA